MAVNEVVPKDEASLERLLRAIEKRKHAIKTRGNKSNIVKAANVEDKKKEGIKSKKEYKSFMKVASFLCTFVLSALWFSSLVMPNFYDAIIAVLGSFDPFSFLKGGNALDPTEFVNLKL